MTFSDDSDPEVPEAAPPRAAAPRSCCARRARPPKSGGSRTSGRSSGPQTRRGQAGARRGPGARAEEERELLRAIEEEEKVEEELEISFEVVRASEDEEGALGELRLDCGGVLQRCRGARRRRIVTCPGDKASLSLPAGRRRLEGAGGEHELWGTSSGGDKHPEGTPVSTLPMADGE